MGGSVCSAMATTVSAGLTLDVVAMGNNRNAFITITTHNTSLSGIRHSPRLMGGSANTAFRRRIKEGCVVYLTRRFHVSQTDTVSSVTGTAVDTPTGRLLNRIIMSTEGSGVIFNNVLPAASTFVGLYGQVAGCTTLLQVQESVLGTVGVEGAVFVAVIRVTDHAIAVHSISLCQGFV